MLKKITAMALMAGFLLLGAPAREANAAVSFGMSANDSGVNGFYLAFSDYYRVPEKEIVVLKRQGFNDEELPVLYFMARTARVAPREVWQLRQSGLSWREIAVYYSLSPGIFFLDNVRAEGRTYGRPYGYYYRDNMREWSRIKLTDNDFINLVNLKFVTARYNCDAREVMKMREAGRTFIVINDEVGKAYKKGMKKHYNYHHR